MNLKKLKQAETDFLFQFPKGFEDPAMGDIKKRHNVPKLIELSQEMFDDHRFDRPGVVLDDCVKIVGRSSMVSMFEKPKFRDFAKSLNGDEKEFFVQGLRERLHGKAQLGFEMMVDLLATQKMAKWSLMSICPFYFSPNDEVFVKPTTAKKVIEVLELQGLVYKPRPTWEFYRVFRDQINEMKQQVDPLLSPNSAAFTGFLMMSL
ncbi:MAG: hypothetical protein AAF420_11840 [Pseudomonadota bacterium]